MGRLRKYNLNEDYFKYIDTNNKAYILGFIFADGSVNKNYLSIKLSKNDIEILEFIKKELEYDGNIRNYIINGREYVDLTICSNRMINDLKKYNIIPNKTYSVDCMPELDEYQISFIRGFFDGDGSIYVYNKRGFNEYTINFSNNRNVLSDLKKFLMKMNISSGNIRMRYNNNISCMLDIRGNINVENFYKIFYSSEDFYLKRKKYIFDKFINDLRLIKKRKFSNVLIDKIMELYCLGNKQTKIAKILNISESSTKSVIQRLRKHGKIK